ncbi:hypothetical protein [Rubripirellula tenax]|nr:hypothetical protein [Rubripirellula tenax]
MRMPTRVLIVLFTLSICGGWLFKSGSTFTVLGQIHGLFATGDGRTEANAKPLANLRRLSDAGWSIPNPTEWWLKRPDSIQLKQAIIAPALNNDSGICIKRFWIPRNLEFGNYDPKLLKSVISDSSFNKSTIARLALRSHFEREVNRDYVASSRAMSDAKLVFNRQIDEKLASGRGFSGFVAASVGTRDELTAVLGLDWIQWSDEAEFEDAFAKVKALIELNILTCEKGGRNWRFDGTSPGEGHWNASSFSTNAYYLEQFLAIGVFGVNPDGESHRWADQAIDRIGIDPTNDRSAVYSTFDAANALNLLSLGNGGGREWGAHDSSTSLGGYETSLAFAATVQLRMFDTATDSKWNLVGKSLYLNSRFIGLCAHEDLFVEHTGFHPDAAGMVETWARMFRGQVAGGRYSWLTQRSPNHTSTKLSLFQALAGPQAIPQAPPSEPFADRVGSRWYYLADQSRPDNTFRTCVHLRSLDCHREIGDERVLRFAVGKVGLVEGHANRSAPNGALSNGIWVGRKAPSGNPLFASNGWWSQGMSQEIYHSPNRASMPMPVASEARYLKGKQPKPVLVDGKYSWTQDWSEWSGTYDGKQLTADRRWTRAVSSFELDTVAEQLQVTDTLDINLTDDLYLGWHFSPSHPPKLLSNGFEFGDGIDLIRVTVEPLGDFKLKTRVRTKLDGFDLGNYKLDLDWHNTGNGGKLDRIAANVSFVPTARSTDGTYNVRVTIQANP